MTHLFVVDDGFHCERQGEFRSMEMAIADVRRRAELPWDEEPNRAPCASWRTCHREIQIIEYDDRVRPWTEIKRIPMIEISARGVVWAEQ